MWLTRVKTRWGGNMPYVHHKEIKLVGTDKDRRRKLTDKQKNEILSYRGRVSQRECAKLFGVSRRLVQFIWNPEDHERNIQRLKEKGGHRVYYDKKKHAEYMKRHRRYKQSVYLSSKGVIKDPSTSEKNRIDE